MYGSSTAQALSCNSTPLYARPLLHTVPTLSLCLSFPLQPFLLHLHQELTLENILPLLVLLARFKGLIVLPADVATALPAHDVAHNVLAGGHAAFAGVALGDVDDGVEEEGFAVLSAEVLGRILVWGCGVDGRVRCFGVRDRIVAGSC